MRDNLPVGTVSFLLTDIEGSTRLLHGLGEAYAGVLAAHRDIVRSCAAAHGGIEVDTQGDAFFIAFPDAIGCVRAAVAVQRGLAAHPWPETGTVRLRMGAHTGEPTRTDEGYVGLDVHAAARICSSGHGGQILLSQRTAQLVREGLEADGISLRDLGEHRLKDLSAPAHLYQVVIPELPSDFSPLRTLETRPNNLPTPPTPFIGRAGKVAVIRDLVLQEGVRVVTLTGPGGTGKSRLGLRVATELLHSFADGAFFVPLAPVRSAELVPAAIARALGVREGRGRTLVESLEEHLRDKELLLLIDNFEHVRQGARALAQLMTQCPRVKALLTSREILRLSGEHDFPVPPLTLPERGLSVEELGRFEAVRLFIDRARAARPGFALDAASAAPVAEICRRLDGLPLAIELAAAQVRSMSPPELLEALESRLSVLTDGPIDLPERQQTLRDAIAWSYDLLDPAEQKLCRRLAVFRGGCTIEAARQVCDLEGDLDVESGASALVDKSLLMRLIRGDARAEKVLQTEGPAERSRYSMLETIREYALAQLDDSAETEALRARHEQWCVRMSEEAEPELRGADSPVWLDGLAEDHDNIRAALSRSLERMEGGAGAALSISTNLLTFWYHHGYFSEARRWLERALAAGPEAEPRLRAKALYGAAVAARYQGEETAGSRYCEDAIALYREVGDRAGVARVLAEHGATLDRLGESERAFEALNEALALHREMGERERTSFTLNMLGHLSMNTGDRAAAIAHFEESLKIASEDVDRSNAMTALLNLAEICREDGNERSARERLRESLPHILELRQHSALAYCLEMIAGIDAALGQGESAARLFGASEALREEMGTPVEPFNLERYRRDVAAARDLLDDGNFQAAWTAGRSLDPHEAARQALGQTKA